MRPFSICSALPRSGMPRGPGSSSMRMVSSYNATRLKVATWNVNGIRARQAQFCDWLARDQPDVVCLQELKAEPGQIPEQCKLANYVTFWHGLRAYSGVSL